MPTTIVALVITLCAVAIAAAAPVDEANSPFNVLFINQSLTADGGASFTWVLRTTYDYDAWPRDADEGERCWDPQQAGCCSHDGILTLPLLPQCLPPINAGGSGGIGGAVSVLVNGVPVAATVVPLAAGGGASGSAGGDSNGAAGTGAAVEVPVVLWESQGRPVVASQVVELRLPPGNPTLESCLAASNPQLGPCPRARQQRQALGDGGAPGGSSNSAGSQNRDSGSASNAVMGCPFALQALVATATAVDTATEVLATNDGSGNGGDSGVQPLQRACEIIGDTAPFQWEPDAKFIDPTVVAERCPVTATVSNATASVRFFALGDWGSGFDPATGQLDLFGTQEHVGAAMDRQAAWFRPQFIVGLGDNFYESGLFATDDPQKKLVWDDMYAPFEHLRNLTWYSTLGNHDYGYLDNPDIILRPECYVNWTLPENAACLSSGKTREQCVEGRPCYYSPIWQHTERFNHPRWVLRNGSYEVPIPQEADINSGVGGNNDVALFLVDNQPMTNLSKQWYMWDAPYGLGAQNPDETMRQLNTQLATSNAKWKIVASHSGVTPFGSHGVKNWKNGNFRDNMIAALQQHEVPIYISAHDHIAQVVRDANGGPTTHVTSGSAYKQDMAFGEGKKQVDNNGEFERVWASADPLRNGESDASYVSVAALRDGRLVYAVWTLHGGCSYEGVLEQ